MIRLVIPLPPSKNRQYLRARNGGVYLDPKVRTFRQEVWAAVKLAHLRKICTPARLFATFHPARAGKNGGDTANRLDQLLDAIEHAQLIENDRLFTDVHCVLGPIVRPSGMCVVDITVLR
jgi:Holliday junction resolvase RusA-like endonuclease